MTIRQLTVEDGARAAIRGQIHRAYRFPGMGTRGCASGPLEFYDSPASLQRNRR